ncbi:unnamed protein product, partial [Musa hybrid cultivar]
MQVLLMGNASTTGEWMGVRSVLTNGEDNERHGSVFKSMIAAVAQVEKWSSTSSPILCIPLFMHDRLQNLTQSTTTVHERNNRPPLFMHERKVCPLWWKNNRRQLE